MTNLDSSPLEFNELKLDSEKKPLELNNQIHLRYQPTSHIINNHACYLFAHNTSPSKTMSSIIISKYIHFTSQLKQNRTESETFQK